VSGSNTLTSSTGQARTNVVVKIAGLHGDLLGRDGLDTSTRGTSGVGREVGEAGVEMTRGDSDTTTLKKLIEVSNGRTHITRRK